MLTVQLFSLMIKYRLAKSTPKARLSLPYLKPPEFFHFCPHKKKFINLKVKNMTSRAKHTRQPGKVIFFQPTNHTVLLNVE